MRAWSHPPYWGCVNTPAYRDIAFTVATQLLTIGGDAIQHDDAATNGGAVEWNGGDPVLSGCYCETCMTGFTISLMQT